MKNDIKFVKSTGLRSRLIAILAVFAMACPNAKANPINDAGLGWPFTYCVDGYKAEPGCLHIWGWMYANNKQSIRLIFSSSAGDQWYDPFWRPDVADTYGLGGLNTGFDVYLPFKSGSYSGDQIICHAYQNGTPYRIFYVTVTIGKPTATFDRQGGTGGTGSTLVDYSCANPTITPPTRAGYVFDGYYTETNGGGTKYYNANGTSANDWKECGGKTLYAKWLVAVCKNTTTNVEYASVQAGINSASNGQTIQMTKNSTGNVTNTKTLILDLNGCVLSANNSGRAIYNTGVLTIVDSNPDAVHYYTVTNDGTNWCWGWQWNDSNTANALQFDTLTVRPAAGSVIALKGGAITGGLSNTASGIYSYGSAAKLNLQAGNIVGNRTYYAATTIYWGGGVKIDYGTCEMTGGNIVGNSICSYGKGAGIDCNGGTFTMTGGLIGFNYARESGSGIYVRSKGTVTLKGNAQVRYNDGGWAYGYGIRCSDGGNEIVTLNVGGSAVVTDNGHKNSDGSNYTRNVQVVGKNVITVLTGADAPTSDMKIGVTALSPTVTSNYTITGTCSEADTTYFFADDNIYTIEWNATAKKLELCGYRMYLDGNGAECSTEFVRTIKGQAGPTLPDVTKAGFYHKWYGIKQTSESFPESGEFTSGMAIDFSKDTTIHCWWKRKFEETSSDAGITEKISGQDVTTDDIVYAMDNASGDVSAVDMTDASSLSDPSEVIDAVHNSTKATPNTLIYLPAGTVVPADKAENVVVKDTTGNKETYKCVNFSVTDKTPVSVPYSFSADVATYKRDSSSRWGTVCVPFKLKSDGGIQYYTSGTVYGTGDDAQIVWEKADTVAAGCPAVYMVSAIDTTGTGGSTSTKKDIVKTDYVKVVGTAASTSGTSVKLVGTFTEKKIASDTTGFNIYYFKDNKFYKRSSGQNVTIPALRAYILIPTE